MESQWPSDEQVTRASSDVVTDPTSSVCSTLFVRGLNYEVMEEQIHSFFEEIGPVKRVTIVKKKNTTISLGYGFVEFALPSDALAAISRYHGTLWMGRKLNLQLAINNATKDQTRSQAKDDLLKEEKRLKNRADRQQKAEYKAEMKAQGLDWKPQSDLPLDVVAEQDGRVLVITGLNDTVPYDRLMASCKRVAPVAQLIYPSVESRDNSLAARITYETKDAARNAAKKFNEKELRGCMVKAFILSGKSAIKAARLIVRNLSFKSNEEDLMNLFAPYGKVLHINIPKSDSGAMRGFAFVQMVTVPEAEKAIAGTNGKEINKRAIAVDWALNKLQFDRMTYFEKLKEENGGVLPVKTDKTDDEEKDTEENDDEDAGDDDEDNDSDSESGSDNDNDSESEHDSEGGDDDEDDEDDEEDEDDDNEVENNMLTDESEKKGSQDVKKGTTIFIRNLSYDTTEDNLFNKFSPFGRIKFCKIVKDVVMNRSMGTAFVQYFDIEDTDAVLSTYGAQNEADMKKVKQTKFKKSVKALDNVIRLDGRDLILARAVDKNEAKRLEDDNKQKKEDKRNLFLSKEGLILPNTPAAEGLAKEDLEKRQRAWKEKKEKLKNPNYFISKVRLSVRNIPWDMTEETLKIMFRTEVQKALQNSGERSGSISVKQAKIVRDMEKLDENGMGRSKGYGFVEFSEHDHALLALRVINNNPEMFTKTRRPIVEFALDDIRKLMVRDKMRANSENKKLKVDDIRKRAEEAALRELGHSVNSEDLKQVFADSAKDKNRKRPFSQRGDDHHGGERRSFGNRDRNGGERRSFGNRDRNGGERRSFGNRDRNGGERRSFGNRENRDFVNKRQKFSS